MNFSRRSRGGDAEILMPLCTRVCIFPRYVSIVEILSLPSFVFYLRVYSILRVFERVADKPVDHNIL